MKSLPFAGATHGLAAPEDWDEEQNGACGTLPVAVTEDGRCVSVWLPSDEQRAEIAAGGVIVLHLFVPVETHPVVALATGSIIPNEQDA